MVTFSNLSKLGRMGNQLWQISAVIGYALQQKIDYCIPVWEYSKFFKFELKQSAIIKPMPVYKETGFNYNRIPRYVHIDLYGYFQSIKYWQHCENTICKLWTPNYEIQAILEKNPFSPNTCAVHVRRTDYLVLKDYHPSLPLKYYQKAIEAMKADNYIFFSDDIEWCKENFKGDNFAYVNSGNDIMDFFAATQCDKFIIANSSYSWWFSYLSNKPNKRIIAPRKENWFGIQYKHKNVDDLYLPLWELI